MEDNAPCHTAKSVKIFLFEEAVTVVEWPAQCPDMNPMRMFGSFKMKDLSKRIQETSKNYGLI